MWWLLRRAECEEGKEEVPAAEEAPAAEEEAPEAEAEAEAVRASPRAAGQAATLAPNSGAAPAPAARGVWAGSG